jgi:hypothetical protein
MSEPQLPDWARINVGAAARDALTLVEEELRSEQYRIDMRAYGDLDSGKLTPEAALSYFASKRALYILHRRLMQKAQQGTGAATRIKKALEVDTNG